MTSGMSSSSLDTVPAPATVFRAKDLDDAVEAFEWEERRELLLRQLHRESLQQVVTLSADCPHSSIPALRRKKIVTWLVNTFKDFSLSDTRLLSTITLLDRTAVLGARRGRSPLAVGQDEAKILATVLAALLIVLKTSAADDGLEHEAKDLVLGMGGRPAQGLWHEIFVAELNILNLVDFRVTGPNALELLEVASFRVSKMASCASPPWAGLQEFPHVTGSIRPSQQFSLIAAFLVELHSVHGLDCTGGLSPLPVVIAALWVVLQTLGAPVRCFDELATASRLLDVAVQQLLPTIASAFHAAWLSPPAQSPVVLKWVERGVLGSLEPVPLPADFASSMVSAMKGVEPMCQQLAAERQQKTAESPGAAPRPPPLQTPRKRSRSRRADKENSSQANTDGAFVPAKRRPVRGRRLVLR